MAKIKEQIIKSIDLENGTFISKDDVIQNFMPNSAYILKNSDETHDRYVVDNLGNINKQVSTISDSFVNITTTSNFSSPGDKLTDFIFNVSQYKDSNDSLNQIQNDRLFFLEKISYVWSPTNRTLTLYDGMGKILSQVSLVSLDNEGTDLRYNSSTNSLELWNADNQLLDSIPVYDFVTAVGTQLQLNSNQLKLKDSNGNILSTVSFSISNIDGLQTALDLKLNNGGYSGTAQDLYKII